MYAPPIPAKHTRTCSYWQQQDLGESCLSAHTWTTSCHTMPFPILPEGAKPGVPAADGTDRSCR